IFKVENEEARVHFIPDLKDGVFVTLCAPVVIKKLCRQTFTTGKRSLGFIIKNFMYFSFHLLKLNTKVQGKV
ncbi:hypothetical protein, partial [Methanosarcina mazei]|uniref:hypothetical protein n=1 Tax=Methanosarcina mazei TaxID=2209 RepID=UPI00064FD9D7